MPSDALAGVEDVGNVRLPILVQGRRNTDNDRVHFPDTTEIRGRRERARPHRLGHGFGGNVLDVTLALVKRVHFGRIDIQSQHGHTRAGELK